MFWDGEWMNTYLSDDRYNERNKKWWKIPVRPSFILQTTYSRSSVMPTLAGPGGRRAPGMWRSPSRPPAAVVALAWGPPTRHGAGAVVAPPKARLGHTGDVHFDILKFLHPMVPAMVRTDQSRRGLILTKPNQTKRCQKRWQKIWCQKLQMPTACKVIVPTELQDPSWMQTSIYENNYTSVFRYLRWGIPGPVIDPVIITTPVPAHGCELGASWTAGQPYSSTTDVIITPMSSPVYWTRGVQSPAGYPSDLDLGRAALSITPDPAAQMMVQLCPGIAHGMITVQIPETYARIERYGCLIMGRI